MVNYTDRQWWKNTTHSLHDPKRHASIYPQSQPSPVWDIRQGLAEPDGGQHCSARSGFLVQPISATYSLSLQKLHFADNDGNDGPFLSCHQIVVKISVKSMQFVLCGLYCAHEIVRSLSRHHNRCICASLKSKDLFDFSGCFPKQYWNHLPTDLMV